MTEQVKKTKSTPTMIMKRHTANLVDNGQVETYINIDERELHIKLNLEIIKYHRNRSGRHSTYDPMGSYKRNLKKMIKQSMIDNDIEIPNEWLSAPIEVDSYFINVPTKSGNGIGKIALMLNNLVHRVKYPDIDNFTKTAFDVLNTLAWNDDAQVVTSNSTKLYGKEERTVIVVKYKEDYHTTDIKKLLALGIVSEEDIAYARKIKNA